MASRLTQFIPLIFVLLWSTGFIAAKYSMPFAEPFWLLLIRSILAVGALVLVALILSQKIRIGKAVLWQMLIGMMIHGAYLGGVFYAIDHGMPAGISALVVGLQPLLTAIIATIMGIDKGSKRIWFGLCLGVFAVTLVVYERTGVSMEGFNLRGMIALLLALFGMSLGTVLQKVTPQSRSLIGGAIWQYAGAILVFGLLTMLWETQAVEWNLQLSLALIWLVLGLSIGAILLLMYMIREGSMTKVASYFYLVPPVTMIEGYFLFDEKIGVIGLIGAVLAVFAIALVNKK